LQSGASPLIVAKSMKACRVAQDEIKQGHVKFVLPEHLVPEPPIDIPN
jgi:DNA-directed RNA polymerase subunit omega